LAIVVKIACCFILFAGNVLAEQTEKTYSESQIKVALVYKLLHFIEWPPSQDLKICIYGANDEDASSFKSMPETTEFGGELNIIFIYKNDDSEIKQSCQIFFFSDNTSEDIQKILTNMVNTPSLTIGESDQFIRQGGMINLIRKDSTLRFEISVSALKQAGLDISSQILRIADQIYTNEHGE